MENNTENTIENNFAKLDEIIAGLENSEMSLEESFKLYQEGIGLIATCNSQLDKVEKEMIVLGENQDE